MKKGQFEWSETATRAFQQLKQALSTTSTLTLPNFNAPFVIQTDVSGEEIQNGQPMAYMSRALGISKQAWSTYTKKMLAIIVAIELWRPHLLGQKFYIETDQRSLKYLLDKRISTPEQEKWVSKFVWV